MTRLLPVLIMFGVAALWFVPAAVGAARDAWHARRPMWDHRDEWHRSKGPRS